MKSQKLAPIFLAAFLTVLSLVPTLASATPFTAITGTVTSNVNGKVRETYAENPFVGYLEAGGSLINSSIAATNVKLASLLWHDKDNVNAGPFNVNWNVLIHLMTPPTITDPNMPTNTLSLTVQTGSNPDTLSLDDISGFSFSTSDSTTEWLVNNFRYVLEGEGTLAGTNWIKNKQLADSTLWIEADFTPRAIGNTNPAAPVPEPGTVMLLGAGFLGLAVYGKRRKNT